MPEKYELTLEESSGKSQSEQIELLAHKILNAWGVPKPYMTLYGRLRQIEEGYPNELEVVTHAMKASESKRPYWYYNNRDVIPVLLDAKPPRYRPGSLSETIWEGPFDSWEDAIKRYLDKRNEDEEKRYNVILSQIPNRYR